MALLGMEGSVILTLLAFLYNMFMSIKLIYTTMKDEKLPKNFRYWNYSSVILIASGSILTFFWYFQAFAPSTGIIGMIGALILFINNIIVTIFVFKKSFPSTLFGKIADILFTLLAMWTFLLLLNKVAVSTAFVMPSFLDWIISGPSIGYTLFQGFMFGTISYYFPILFLLPIAVPIKFVSSEIAQKQPEEETKEKVSEDKKPKKKKIDVFLEDTKSKKPVQEKSSFEGIRSFLDNGTKMIFSMFIIVLLMFNFSSIGTMSSFSQYTSAKYNPSFVQRADFEFGVTLQTASYQLILRSNYIDILNAEMDLMEDLGATLARMDLKAELVEKNISELNTIVQSLHSRSFHVMFSTYGYGAGTWNFLSVPFTNYTEVINDQAITIAQELSPDYLLIYPEPLGFARAFVTEGEAENITKWFDTIEQTITAIRAINNQTKIGINLSFYAYDSEYCQSIGSNQTLFEKLWADSSLDFIGLDIYPFRGSDLDLTEVFQKVTNSTKEFWITEFGISPMVFGERIQAGALTKMLDQAINNPQVKGFVYFSLTDNSLAANAMGLVSDTGYKRLAFKRYKEIIEEIKQ
ncbi:MAG: hypothetical protein ACTSYD_07190 [Candidatus Heimdallarchaeaceae archaeon]